MLRFLLVICIFAVLSMIYAQPTPLKCEDIGNPQYRQFCWFRFNLAHQEKGSENDDHQYIQKKNSELSTALYSLYGDNSPGKRNPELSSALMRYIDNMKNSRRN